MYDIRPRIYYNATSAAGLPRAAAPSLMGRLEQIASSAIARVPWLRTPEKPELEIPKENLGGYRPLSYTGLEVTDDVISF